MSASEHDDRNGRDAHNERMRAQLASGAWTDAADASLMRDHERAVAVMRRYNTDPDLDDGSGDDGTADDDTADDNTADGDTDTDSGTDTADGAAGTDDTADEEPDQGAAAPADPPAQAGGLEGEGDADSFGQGLNGDRGAILPAVMWGIAAAAILGAAGFVARRWRRWPSYVVAITPFAIVLFICFVHIDQALPSY